MQDQGLMQFAALSKAWMNILQLSSESSSNDEERWGTVLIILRTSTVCVFSGPVASAQSQALACFESCNRNSSRHDFQHGVQIHSGRYP